jgi:hypothetical protein
MLGLHIHHIHVCLGGMQDFTNRILVVPNQRQLEFCKPKPQSCYNSNHHQPRGHEGFSGLIRTELVQFFSTIGLSSLPLQDAALPNPHHQFPSQAHSSREVGLQKSQMRLRWFSKLLAGEIHFKILKRPPPSTASLLTPRQRSPRGGDSDVLHRRVCSLTDAYFRL